MLLFPAWPCAFPGLCLGALCRPWGRPRSRFPTRSMWALEAASARRLLQRLVQSGVEPIMNLPCGGFVQGHGDNGPETFKHASALKKVGPRNIDRRVGRILLESPPRPPQDHTPPLPMWHQDAEARLRVHVDNFDASMAHRRFRVRGGSLSMSGDPNLTTRTRRTTPPSVATMRAAGASDSSVGSVGHAGRLELASFVIRRRAGRSRRGRRRAPKLAEVGRRTADHREEGLPQKGRGFAASGLLARPSVSMFGAPGVVIPTCSKLRRHA